MTVSAYSPFIITEQEAKHSERVIVPTWGAGKEGGKRKQTKKRNYSSNTH